MSGHSNWSPSSASRRLRCLGSLHAEAPYPETSSDAADEGTAAHRLFEVCVKTGTEARRHIGKQITVKPRSGNSERVFLIDDTMSDNIQEGVDLITEFPGKVASEIRVSLGRWMRGQWGTIDIAGIAKDYFLIHDLKYGFGEVEAEDNAQLMLYALGFWDKYIRGKRPHIKKALLRIHQPRLFGGNRIKEFWITVDELLAFGEEVRKAYRASKNPNAPRTPGASQCNFCKAYLDCPELAAYVTGILGMKDGTIDMKSEITPERRSQLVLMKGMITKWIERQEQKIRDDYMAGLPTPGIKLVEGRGTRSWEDEEEARGFLSFMLNDDAELDAFIEDLLADDDKLRQFIIDRVKEKGIIKAQLISPAEAEKKLGKKAKGAIAEFVTVKQSAPMLVPDTDKRDAITTIDSLFDDLEYDDDLFGEDPLSDLI